MKLIKNNIVKSLATFALISSVIGWIFIITAGFINEESNWDSRNPFSWDGPKNDFSGLHGALFFVGIAFLGVQLILGILLLVFVKDLVKPKGITIASGVLSILCIIPFASIVLLIICVSISHGYKKPEAEEIKKLKEELKTLMEKNKK